MIFLIGTERRKKMFKYLHRDGDRNMSFFDLVKREMKELKKQKAIAKNKFEKKTYKKFRKWITYYHRGMFLKPNLSRQVTQIQIDEKDGLILNFRKNQSDLYILQENFVSEIYDFEFEKYLKEVKVIFDLGANIGLSSLYFQHRFKDARIFCVEPVEENIKMLSLNRDVNNFHWEIIKAAIQAQDGTTTLYPNEWWSSSTVLDCVADHRENTEGRLEKIYKLPKEQVTSYSINYLMKKYKISFIDIMKMDIEGSEEEVILKGKEWIKYVKILIVEIHDKYVNRKAILDELYKNGFVQIRGRKGPTDVFLNKEYMVVNYEKTKLERK